MTAEIIFDTPAVRHELATTAPALVAAPHVAGLLFDESMSHAQGPLLDLYIQLLDEWLRTRQAATRTDRLHLINLRHALLVRRETAELAQKPVALADVAAAATRFARKAQASFSSASLPPPATLAP